ncbi:MAG: phosphoribosylamine--glycine ligase [Candidatus Aminicenantes bacterium]|jgi:phosphoribosylamine--glycine ligase|nr:phosphoribosylamine--glycine ligase [Candidatus Aminicenantes bacterium]
MRVLVIGSGGREHALAWKISQSPLLKKLFCAPGNPGTAQVAENVPINETDITGLSEFAGREKIDLTVVGPELPLTLGIVDEFESQGLRIFGPSKKAAELEGSKIFAKQFMERHRIPTARFKIAETDDQALKIINSGTFGFPLVIKADGPAGGKGAVVCPNMKKAEETIQAIMVKKQFGEGNTRVVIEEFLRGREASFIVISDGTQVQPLVTAMDHKTAYEGDRGPNTGGMGAVSPSPFITKELFMQVSSSIIFPTITRMLEEGRRLRGVLYAGLMLTEQGPKLLEYNCRFGDPETQAQLLRMESDFLEILLSAVFENVLSRKVRWSAKVSGCVVLASGGYPVRYETGKVIEGLDQAEAIPGVTVFQAGTRMEKRMLVTNGGRVLNVCALDTNLAGAMGKAYEAVSAIRFEAMHYRRDIGCEREEAG